MSTIVFTNGCFDLLHPGHIDLLETARALGDRLVVGVNSDESVRAIKGAGRPLVPQEDRAAVLRALRCVDEVIIFDEPTPERLIKEVRPNVLIKGGDWPLEHIIGADFVLANGGSVKSIPHKSPYSSTSLVERMQLPKISGKSLNVSNGQNNKKDDVAEFSFREHQEVIEALSNTAKVAIRLCAQEMFQALTKGQKILLCGNGGSAADAQHIAAELVGRFESERRALPAIALTTDTSALTAVSNDYGFENVFSRQVTALARPGDVLVGISTSGNSPNILSAVMTARGIGCRIVGLTGSSGKRLASLCDAAVLVPSTRTSRIQEAHIAIGHIWCEMVDKWLDEEAV